MSTQGKIPRRLSACQTQEKRVQNMMLRMIAATPWFVSNVQVHRNLTIHYVAAQWNFREGCPIGETAHPEAWGARSR